MGEAAPSPDDVWVFGYASLLWNTGFPYRAVEPARLLGYRRALCIYSHIYRGSRDKPGLVAGLMPGGSCRGLAFRVAGSDWEDVRGYLHEREMIYDVYVPTWAQARVGAGGERMHAYTFVANRAHAQFAGALELDETARLIREGQGTSGTGIDYLSNTVARLAELGIRDRALERILAAALKGSDASVVR